MDRRDLVTTARPSALATNHSPSLVSVSLLAAIGSAIDPDSDASQLDDKHDRRSSPSPPSPPVCTSVDHQLGSETEITESAIALVPPLAIKVPDPDQHQPTPEQAAAARPCVPRRRAQCEDRLFDDDGTGGGGMPLAFVDGYKPCLKIVVVGRSGAGKTSALLSLMENRTVGPQDGVQTTIGVNFFNYEFKRGGRDWKFSLWDTAGQERFKSIVSSYLRATHGVVGVVDMYALQQRMADQPMDNVDRPMSAAELADQYAEKEFDAIFGEAFATDRANSMRNIIYTSLRERPLFLLMGNKIDRLVDDPEDMPLRNSLKRICERRGGRFIDTSVSDGHNVKYAWGRMMLDLIDVVRDHENRYGVPVQPTSANLGYDAFQQNVAVLRIAPYGGEAPDAKAQGNLQCSC